MRERSIIQQKIALWQLNIDYLYHRMGLLESLSPIIDLNNEIDLAGKNLPPQAENQLEFLYNNYIALLWDIQRHSLNIITNNIYVINNQGNKKNLYEKDPKMPPNNPGNHQGTNYPHLSQFNQNNGKNYPHMKQDFSGLYNIYNL